MCLLGGGFPSSWADPALLMGSIESVSPVSLVDTIASRIENYGKPVAVTSQEPSNAVFSASG